MSDKITLGNLKARCRFPIVTLQQCHIHAKCGEHTEAEITCTVKRNAEGRKEKREKRILM